MEYPLSRRGASRSPWSLVRDMSDLLDWDLIPAATTGLEGMPLNIEETDERYQVEAELPGVKRDEVQLSMDGNVLTISVSQKEEKEEKERRFVRRERRMRTAERQIQLPLANEQGDVKAQLANGILTIEVPKEPEKQARRIEIH
jgi:HSP20 family protein